MDKQYGRGLVVNGKAEMFKQFFPDLDVNVSVTGSKNPPKNLKALGYDAIVFNMILSSTSWDGVQSNIERQFSLLRPGSKFALVEPVIDWLYTKSPDEWEWADMNAHVFGVEGNKSLWRLQDVRAILEIMRLRVTSANVARYEFNFSSGRQIKPFLGVIYGEKPE